MFDFVDNRPFSMNPVQDIKIPPGCEMFATNAALGSRIGYSGQAAGRLIVTGALKPAEVTPFATFYRSSDLDALKRNTIAAITAKCARLTDTDRQQLAATLTSGKLEVATQRMSVRLCKSIVA